MDITKYGEVVYNFLKLIKASVYLVLFATQFKQFFATEDKPLSVYQRLAAGGSAGVVAQTSIYPMEVSVI